MADELNKSNSKEIIIFIENTLTYHSSGNLINFCKIKGFSYETVKCVFYITCATFILIHPTDSRREQAYKSEEENGE